MMSESNEKTTKEQILRIKTEYIKLDQMLKFAGAVYSGGEAKEQIGEGTVSVNGETCLVRGKKLRAGDVVRFNGETFRIEAEAE